MGRIINNFINESKNLGNGVVEKWSNLGFLEGIEEGKQKYLADLYEALADALINNHTIGTDVVGMHIKFNILAITDLINNRIYEDDEIGTFLETALFPIIRRVYLANPTISFNEFVDGLHNVYINNSFINDVLECSHRQKCDKEAEMCAFIADEINKYVNENK